MAHENDANQENQDDVVQPETSLQDLGLLDFEAGSPGAQDATVDAALAELAGLRAGGTNLADPFNIRGVYSPIPLSELRMDVAINELLSTLAFTDSGHMLAQNTILSSLEAMEQTPEVAHLLATPSEISDWQAEVWPMVIESMALGNTPGQSHLGIFKDLDIQADDHMKDWVQNFSWKFSSEEMDLLYQIFSAAPTWEELAENAIEAGSIHVRPMSERSNNVFLRGWRQFKTGLEVIWNAPEVMSASFGSPRGNILTQSALYLNNNDITDIVERDRFFSWLLNETNEEAARMDRLSGGFDKLAARTVAAPITAAKGMIKEQALRMGDPNEYMWRQGLTMGQSFAVQLGFNPGDKYTWDLFSGAADGVIDIGLDPLTWAGGLAGGMRNVRNVPRYTTRLEAFKNVANPHTSSKLGFGFMDRGMIPRMWWAATSKHIDDFADTPDAWKAWNWIAEQANSAADILVRFPNMSNVPEKELERLAALTEGIQVRDVYQSWLSNAPQPGAKTAKMVDLEIAELITPRMNYRKAQKAAIDDGTANLRGLDAAHDGVYPGQVFERSVPSGAFDEAVVRRLADNGPRLQNSEEIFRTGIKGGEEVVIRQSRPGTLGAFIDGEWVGGVENARALDEAAPPAALDELDDVVNPLNRANLVPADPEVGVLPEHRGKGIFSALYGSLDEGGKHAIDVSPSRSASLDLAQGRGGVPVYKQAKFTGSGARRTVASTVGDGPLQTVDLNNPIEMDVMIEWLSQEGMGLKGARELAAAISSGMPLDNLTQAQKLLLREYMIARATDGLQLGDQTILSSRMDQFIINGFDDRTAKSAVSAAPVEAQAMVDADIKLGPLKANLDTNLFVSIELPRRRLGNKFQALGHKLGRHMGNGRYMQGLRRQGFQMAHALPGTISLTHGARGAVELRNWIKALGGGEELALKWMQTFLDGNMTTRQKTVQEAFQAVGRTIDNPQLREGLVQFFNKQGHRNFAAGSNGVELGSTAQGSILPMTITHLTNEMVMPNAKGVIKSVRRFKREGSTPIHRRGFLQGTKENRQAIVTRLKANMRARGVDVDNLTDDEWLAVGYADVLTNITGRSRADALGAVNKLAGMAYAPFKWLHNVFTIGQLAFRPLAWSGRILIEETIRADLVGLPSLWKNPAQYISGIMDARAITKMSDDAAGQARVLDGLVEAKLFEGGKPNELAIFRVFPNIDEMLDASNVSSKNASRYKAFLAHELGKSLIGGEATTNARIGSRFNWARRTARRNRRQQRAHRALDDAVLLESFRFQTQAQEITNRSLVSEYISEVESGFVDMEWRAGAMAPQGLDAYGRGWGRQVFQMFGDDPLVRNYGLPRAVAQASGNPAAMDAEKLIHDPNWQLQLPMVRRFLDENGVEGLTPLEEADWYLRFIVDELAKTLLHPLADGDIRRQGEIAQALLDRQAINLEFGDGVEHTIDLSSDNYEGVVQAFIGISHSRNALGQSAPAVVSAVVDPRFGQRKQVNPFRRVTDWIMQKAGEDATQALNRKPSYLAIHGTYYNFAIEAGADPTAARAIAHEKATEIVNYIFFNNKDIPQFLKDMNKVIPFFSAMYEVSQTWLYKIPAHEGWPIGAAHLVRKVDRTLDALHNVGILETDPETGQMSMRAGPKEGPFGQALFAAMRAPSFLAEHMVGVGRLALGAIDLEGELIEAYNPGNFGAWSKDGFTLPIGNPLDPQSHGIMAVNQLSVGPTPAGSVSLSFMIGKLTERYASVDRQTVDTDGLTLGEYALQNPDVELAEVLHINRDALEVANSKEKVARAFSDGDPSELHMPDSIVVPKSSFWETLTDDLIFPFGKYESLGQVLTSPSPAALNHVWRGVMTQFGQEDSEIMGFLFGEMSNYQMTGEVIYSLQHLEATEGLATEISDLALEREKMIEHFLLETYTDPNGVTVALDPTAEGADDLIELSEKIERLNMAYLSRAHSNAAGSSILRGLTGSFLPATPRMFDDQQLEAAAYWDQKNLAEDAIIRGSGNYADLLKTLPNPTGKDLRAAHAIVNAYMNDPSGSQAKVWVRQNNPSLEPFLKGKTYWDGGTPPPEALDFDRWMADMQSGIRKRFDPEVWVARLQRAAVSIDKEVAIIDKYGNDPNAAAQRILFDYDSYLELTEEFDMAFAAQDYLDSFIYEGKYRNWREQRGNKNEGLLSELTARVRFLQNSFDATVDMLEFMDLDTQEERRIRGTLTSGVRELTRAIDELNERDTEDQPWLGHRDKVLINYWENITAPYYEGRTKIFNEQVDLAKNSRERSIAFDNLRLYDNEHLNTTHSVEGYEGIIAEMPSELHRAWNTKDPKEREERIYAIIDKKPEWLNDFQVAILLDVAPQLAEMLPVTPEDWDIYNVTNTVIRELQEAHEADPNDVTQSQLDIQVGKVKEVRDTWLLENGRGSEVLWREWFVPAQQLDFAGLLPDSLKGTLPLLNAALDALRAEDKSPTTNAGTAMFLIFKQWLETTYFPANPTAETDLAELGRAMFDETLQSAVFARLFQGDRFGKLE